MEKVENYPVLNREFPVESLVDTVDNYENCTGVAAKKIRLRFFEKTEKVEHFFPEIQVRRTESVRLLWTNWRRVARSFLYLRYVKA